MTNDNRDLARRYLTNTVDVDAAWALRGASGRRWIGYAWGYVSHFGGWAS